MFASNLTALWHLVASIAPNSGNVLQTMHLVLPVNYFQHYRVLPP
jgi:hypothetical protein